MKNDNIKVKSAACLVLPLERHLDRDQPPGEDGDVHVRLRAEVSVIGSVFNEVLSRDVLLFGHEEPEVGMRQCETDL